MAKRIFLFLIITFLFSSIALAESGLVSVRSNHSVTETGNRLESILKEKGMKIVEMGVQVLHSI